MKIPRIRVLIMLAAIAIIGIVITQVFWIRKGLLINQTSFENAVVVTLDRIANNIWLKPDIPVGDRPQVIRISPRSYLVQMNMPIDLNYLDNQLRGEFTNPFHKIDFTYEVFEHSTDMMVFSDSVYVELADDDFHEARYLPNLTESGYYFKVNFPQRPIVPSIMITIWATAILILTTVIIFFTYSLVVIVRQQRLSDFQNAFINNLAHEFKTPLSTIGISAGVLKEPEIIHDPKRLQVYSNIIELENERLKGQVNKILELARLENREIILRKEPINLRQLLEEIVPPFMVQLEAREGKFHKECPDTPCVVTADRIHLKNVINTLLDNALKYSEGTPEIGIRIHCGEKNIYIQVIDNGIGIPKEYHKRIYEKFFRVPTGDVHNVKGFGLGLSYVKMIAKAAGWKISLQSELNKGSTFSIGIPANTPMNDEQ
ncbi:MAG: HAMP domain-containing histidine kinase [Chitinophagales bacterium]|nr:HAMP domain-containing histidine kinase [Chitinophagales bacterium]HAE14678.1 hypothetical protein [Bacteroidota bacterium]MCB9019393.1 HAMP domain-containing histidine kinase [Chitinophagales bacterium]MCB9022282.1 HAMP domain-containing histidine kinase [Chitinophagales bacterium]HPE98661.1 HAMP domain-containing sensor histidine kinase [Chitinophagales bacterium]